MTKIEQRRKLLAEAKADKEGRIMQSYALAGTAAEIRLAEAAVNDYAALLEGQETLKAVRVFIQDCIERNIDSSILSNLYASRDAIDSALAKFEGQP